MMRSQICKVLWSASMETVIQVRFSKTSAVVKDSRFDSWLAVRRYIGSDMPALLKEPSAS